jgi:hypothetical protein
MPAKTFEARLLEGLNVTLKSIEFDNEYEGDDRAPHRTYFLFRFHAEEAWQDFSVTMTEPYEDIADLHQQAWTELYSLLRNFAEVIRRRADLPEVTFTDAP